MDQLQIERVGGMAGFGGPHLKSKGQMASADLSAPDRKTVDALFANPPSATPATDEFSYRLTRHTTAGPQTVQVPERHVPPALRACVKDELA